MKNLILFEHEKWKMLPLFTFLVESGYASLGDDGELSIAVVWSKLNI